MSMWSKLAGAADSIGLPGPLGDLLRSFDSGRGVSAPHGAHAPERSVAFSIALIALSAKLAKADGSVSQDEIAAFGDVLHVPQGEAGNVARVFNLAGQATAGFEGYARQVARMFRDNPAVLEDVLDALFHIAKADGVMHPSECAYLEEVAEIFGFSEAEWRRLKITHLGRAEDDPYVVLGIDPDASDQDVRTAYRRLARDNHPDRMMARGVPSELIGMANEKLAAINAAHARIRAERGLK
ncbi:TerB family tellurite resistance protein [Futiania mangrovi]|uniref:TerB family tellurite resistance protein n=1 Tax=Futiania mangrovi TaxID=2959716 RepID=A0A9J6PAB2_9PROT|nr:TerB family tellurite resistance protein [Futiania mangrovii]MCP1334942.1 TerB family tellurite resistance protein [Futiania mangrovii]